MDCTIQLNNHKLIYYDELFALEKYMVRSEKNQTINQDT